MSIGHRLSEVGNLAGLVVGKGCREGRRGLGVAGGQTVELETVELGVEVDKLATNRRCMMSAIDELWERDVWRNVCQTYSDTKVILNS